jgi:hypothetical protein
VHGLSLLCVLAAIGYLLTVKASGPVTAPLVAEPAPEPAAEEVV